MACVVGPVLGALALGLAWLIVHPATADLAAQEYRTGLWRREGFAIWDAQWYGGHHEPGYSLLFGPLAALLGPRALGFVAGVVAVAALTVIARRQERFPRLVGWLFAAGCHDERAHRPRAVRAGIALGALAWLCADARAGVRRCWRSRRCSRWRRCGRARRPGCSSRWRGRRGG